jgi:hypothetical protein
MRLLKHNSAGEFCLTEDIFDDDKIPPYAILSHTWRDGQEVTFQELIDGTGKGKPGYEKIQFSGEQAKRDGLQYFWVDTCCINKSNNSELTEAINSMFRWYRSASRCYVYLSDVSSPVFDTNDGLGNVLPESAFRASRWFSRGWTLQELLAPSSVKFFSREGKLLGDKKTLERQVHEITGIAVSALQGAPLSQFSVDERFSWARNRQTSRKEDKAYSLLGIFNVHMPLIYGEETENAFRRLLEEIGKSSKGECTDIDAKSDIRSLFILFFSSLHTTDTLKDTVKGEPKTGDPRTQPMSDVGESTLTNVSQSAVGSVRLCLLSLDGGGLRGLSSLYILKTIMTYLNAERNKNGLKEIEKPCEAFDLIGGTSTGG